MVQAFMVSLGHQNLFCRTSSALTHDKCISYPEDMHILSELKTGIKPKGYIFKQQKKLMNLQRRKKYIVNCRSLIIPVPS